VQEKIDAYNKIVENGFQELEELSNINDDKLRHVLIVRAYNSAKEHGESMVLTHQK
jgi:hypothetical protein